MRLLPLFRPLLACAAAALLSSYALWTQSRPSSHYLSDLRSQVSLNLGQPASNGNLLGIEAQMFSGDYQSIEMLHLKLAAYLDKARSEGLLNGKTVAVLPEHIGTWLLASGEKKQVYQAQSLHDGLLWLVASHPLQFSRALLASRGEDRLADAVLRMKGAQMARDYQRLFGGLAQEFGITLVAGSIVLPEPRVEKGALMVGDGPLYNVSLTFASDGTALGQPQRKLFPGSAEQAFSAAGAMADWRAIDTPAGRVGVLLGTDSWHSEAYAALTKQQVAVLLVPAFQPGNHSAIAQWQQQTIASSNVPTSMRVFLRGQLWDVGSSGQSQLLSQQHVNLADDSGHGARLLNIWL